MKILIIIPAYNEENTIKNLIEELENTCPNVDYVVVNDASSDDTLKVLKEINANHLSVAINLGIGGAVKAGYMYARDNEYDIAVQVDGDGQHDVAYLQDLIKPIMSKEYDMAIGSRFVCKEGFQSSVARRIGIKLLSILIKLVSGASVQDVTSGFRAVNREYINFFAEDYPDDYPEPEVIVSAKLRGAKIIEVPVVMRERVAGTSSINIKKSIYYMVKVSLAIIICRISLGIRRYR